MSLEITGKIKVKYETQQVSATFKKREFVIELAEEINGNIYTNFAKMQLVQAKCEVIDRFNVGDMVKVSFNLKGNMYNKDGKTSYITNLDAWRVESAGAQQQAPKNEGIPVHSSSHTTNGGSGYANRIANNDLAPSPEAIDDLPF